MYLESPRQSVAQSKARSLKVSLRLSEEKIPFRTPEDPCRSGFLRKGESSVPTRPSSFSVDVPVVAATGVFWAGRL